MRSQSEEERLIETLQQIEALHAGATTPGERRAAASAIERMQAKLEEYAQHDEPVEYTFRLQDGWSRRLFLALLRRYEIRSYRYPRQRRTTVMARISKTFVDDVLWPEYQALSTSLTEHLNAVTERVIRAAIHDGDGPEIERQTSLFDPDDRPRR